MTAPRHSIFISYRRVDSVYAVDQLDQRLKQSFGTDAIFRDASTIEPGAEFPRTIRDALDEARVALVVIGPWWLRATTDPDDPNSPRRIDEAGDWVRLELETLLGRADGVTVIPVLLGGARVPKAAELPPTLEGLPARNGMQLRPFPDFASSLRQLVDAVAKILAVTPRPVEQVADPAAGPPRFGGRTFDVTGRKFIGRESELHLLDEAWGRTEPDKLNVVSLIGQGGEGKSAIVVEWLARRSRQGWKSTRRVFEWSFFSQGTSDQSSASADEFFVDAFAWFDPAVEVPKDPHAKGAKLAEIVAAERTLLVLDGLEPLQHPPGGYGGEFKDPAMKALLRGLARHNPGLCLLTSRVGITDLARFEGAGGPCLRHRLESLDPEAARALLRELGVEGPDRELDEAAAWFHRHAYDLNLLGNYLAKCTTDHDIRGWQQRFPILREDERIRPVADETGRRAGHGVRMLRAYERWLGADSLALAILRLLGLFDRPARSDLLDELRAEPVIPGLTEALVDLTDADWLRALSQLEELALIRRQSLVVPAGRDEVEQVTIAAAEVPDHLVDRELLNPRLPDELKRLSRTEFRQRLAGLLTDQRNEFARSAERPRRAVTFALDAHPLLREHFGAELRASGEDAWRSAHRRLYRYLCETTADRPDAKLEDLQPLYQAVAHGCHAGLQQQAHDDVHLRRIRRFHRDYSTNKLGAYDSDLRAFACFFEEPWSKPTPALGERDQAILLGNAAHRLRAVGRLRECPEPMRESVVRLERLGDLQEAANAASNLSELRLMLAEVGEAVTDAERAVAYADRSDSLFQQYCTRATHAHALHQAGRLDEAAARFREAERMQGERQPDRHFLYSLRGFQYCELLLADAERSAWRALLHKRGRWPGSGAGPTREHEGPEDPSLRATMESCRAVSQRATQICEWIEQTPGSLLDVALCDLSRGRAGLYAAVLSSDSLPSPTFELAADHLASAVSGLRDAGTTHHLPRGLLACALQRGLAGAGTQDAAGQKSAQADLGEAWEVSKRGPMPLFLADVHLHRARLFGFPGDEGEYPWESPERDLAEARRLIEKHGYLRRMPELEDAEAALLPGPSSTT